MDDETFTSDTAAAMNRHSLLEQLAITRSLFCKESSADDAATAAARNRNVVEGRAREGVRLINDQMAAVSTELLLTVMSDMMLLRLLDGLGLEEGRAVPSSDAASDQQLMMMMMDAATYEKKKKRAAASAARKKKRYKRNKAAAKHENKKTKLMSWLGGGLISLIMMIAFGSITMSIFPLSLIHQSDGSGEGKAPPALPPSASRPLRRRNLRSNDVESDSSDMDIISPLPAVGVVPLAIFSPTFVGNRRMKADEMRASLTCLDTPNWEDIYGDGCDFYDDYYCSIADEDAGDMGSASVHCCICEGGSHSLPPTNSPTTTNSPTKSESDTPSSSSKPSSSPTKSANPTQFCLDTPNWEDKYGQGCDWYEAKREPGCFGTNDDAAHHMGLMSEHCCYCEGGSSTCEDFRSKCHKYINVEGLGIKDGVVSPLCKEAESCSCEGEDHDVKISNDGFKVSIDGSFLKQTVGLYNECKCDFWWRLCEDTGVGEACDYAAEYCCGDYRYWVISGHFEYQNSPTCYCDFFNYAQKEFGHSLKPKSHNISKEFENLCGKSWSSRSKDERTSLEAIYEGINGKNWTNSAGWMNKTVEHCEWHGISCNADGFVTSIDLRDNNLAGQFPVYTRITSPCGENNWEWTKYGLANLYYLETLDLADNRLTGTIEYLPLYNLALLTHFDTSGNQISGGVDALVSPSLTYADFSNNHFTSMHRFKNFKGTFQLLHICDVSNNAIQNDATDLLHNFPTNIEQFIASNNQFYGSLPESSNNLPKLRQFDMSSNSLSESLPEWLNNLPELRRFDMSSNALSGELPDFAESILSLQELDLSNQTNGFTGSIPEDLSKFQSLKILNLAGNKLAGTIPSAIGNMAVLEVFDLSNNHLESYIPVELGLLAGTLKRLGFANNSLSGMIPSEIGQLQGASVLLKDNRFQSNNIAPLSLCMLRSVEAFDLANDTSFCPIERNALIDFYDSAKGAEWTDGSLWLDEYASCCNWTGVTCEKNRVTKLNLSNNGLSGRLSKSIGILTSIEVLDLSDNDIKVMTIYSIHYLLPSSSFSVLTITRHNDALLALNSTSQGSIPAQIGLLSNLTYLRLSYNAFTGAAPESLGELTQLQLLQLQTNRITKMPNIPQLDESIYNKATFVTDCGVPFAFDEALFCDNCTMCCEY
eukprot:scaffold4339_cov100-Skeletonema_dohrnii-CCMP3373.AAC.4